MLGLGEQVVLGMEWSRRWLSRGPDALCLLLGHPTPPSAPRGAPQAGQGGPGVAGTALCLPSSLFVLQGSLSPVLRKCLQGPWKGRKCQADAGNTSEFL